MPLCFFSYKHAAFYSALAVRTFISFVPFFPSLVCQRAFYCPRLLLLRRGDCDITTLLLSLSSISPDFYRFFLFFLYRRCTTFVYERRRYTSLHAPPLRPKSRLLKVLFYFFRVFALVFFPNFDTTDLTAYRLRKFCNKFNNTRTLVQRSFVFHKVKKLNLKFAARCKSGGKNYRRLHCLTCRKRSPGTARTV